MCLVAASFQQNVQQQEEGSVLDEDDMEDAQDAGNSQVSQVPQVSQDSQDSQDEIRPTSGNELKDQNRTPYSFAYDSGDEAGNLLSRKETSDESGAVRGSYSYLDADGLFRTVEYVADKDGFRANIKTNEPGLNGKEEASPAGVTIQREKTPTAVLNRISAAQPATKAAPSKTSPVQQTQEPQDDLSAPTKSAPSKTATASPARPSAAQAAGKTAGDSGNPTGILLLQPQQPLTQNQLSLNPVMRMFQLVPMRESDHKTSTNQPTFVMLLPQPVTQTQQEEGDFSEDLASLSE